MRKRARLIDKFLCLISLILLLAGIAMAEDFSADMISRSKGGVFQGRIFFTGEKVRMETPESIAITRLDRKVMWMLMPKEKKYMEMPLQAQNMVVGKEQMPGEIERKFLGKEIIEGKTADKYRIVYSSANQQQAILTWMLTGSGIPVKTVAEDGSWSMEYKNIRIGKQPDSLFEIPAGYQKFSYSMPSLSDISNYIK